MAASLLLTFLAGILCYPQSISTVAAVNVQVVIDAYPNTTQVSQGTTVVLICHVAGVPSDTMVTYQWSCPKYGCNARGLQPDGNIPSRRQEGNIVVVDVVNTTDSGTYTCTVTSSGSSLGSGTYSIGEVNAGIVLTGRNGLVPVNSFFTDNSSVLTPFEGTVGNYIRCGSIGGSPDWYRANGKLFGTSNTNNNYYYNSSNSAEFWHSTDELAVNREVECRPDSSLNLPSGWIGLFFMVPTETVTIGEPIVSVSSITTNSTTLYWSDVPGTARYYVSYERTDLSISLTPTYIRLVGISNTTVTIPGLEPGAMYRIRVWASSNSARASSPHEIHMTTNEDAPTAPRHLTVVRNTSTSVDLNWIPPLHPNGVIHYEIEYSTSENFVEKTTINTGSNITCYTVNGVFKLEVSRYYFRVLSVNTGGVGRSSSSNVVDVCLGVEMAQPTNITVESGGTNSTVVTWTSTTRDVTTCSGGVTYTVNVSITSGGPIVQRNVKETSITFNVELGAVTGVSVVVVSAIGNSEPGVWTPVTTPTTPGTTTTTLGTSDQTTPIHAGAVVGGIIAVILCIIIIAIVVGLVVFFVRQRRRNVQAASQTDIKSGEFQDSPLSPPRLAKLKLQEDVSSSADCLLEHDGGGNSQAGLSTPVLAPKIPKSPIRDPASSKPATVEEFLENVEVMHHKGKSAFLAEFNSVDTKTSDSIAAGEANIAKNRYKNIFPYDHSRVVLSVSTTDVSDYINASYIDGYKKYNHYIAAQGPTSATLKDFCQMLWETRMPMIVMVTRLMEGTKRKCEQYYPDIAGETLTFGPYTLKTRKVSHFVDFEVRTIEISSEGSSGVHAFDHFLFTGWPDYGVPKYPTSLLRMLYHVRECRTSEIPIVVHCSAGVGRTGTFIALDCILDQINEENAVDVREVLKRMREKRMWMVQTVDQYTFLYNAVRELLLCGDTSVRTTDLRRHIAEFNNSGGFEQQFKILGQLTQDSGDDKKATELTDKIRYKDRLPVQGKHVYVPTACGTVFYNASLVDGYDAPKAFIAAQSPLSNTVSDFWSLIVSKKVSAVALLCPLWEQSKEMCHRFWPDQDATATYDGIVVTTTHISSKMDYDEYRFTVQQENVSLEVSLFHYKQWLEDGRPDLVSLLKYLMSVEEAKQTASNHPVVVACNDGLGRSGTFIAIWSLIEQMKTEGQIDVLSTVKSIRTQRPGAVECLDYYIACYDAVLSYLDSFEGYSNVPF